MHYTGTLITQRETRFWLPLNQPKSDCIHHFPIDLEHQTEFRLVPNQQLKINIDFKFWYNFPTLFYNW